MGRYILIGRKKIIAIIPARSKSKGLRNKNIKNFSGKPLVTWTISQAKNSKYIDEIFVSTDSKNYQNIIENFGISIPKLRPKYLSNDNVSSFRVIEYVLKLCKKNNKFFDYIILLEPTSPLRKKNDIDSIIKKFHRCAEKIDGMITVGDLRQYPSLTYEAENEFEMKKYFSKIIGTGRRQDEVQLLTIYGVAYIFKIDVILKERNLNLRRLGYFKIEKYQEIEIDDIVDFHTAEFLFKEYHFDK